MIRKYLARETDREKWEDGDYAPEQAFVSDLTGNTVDYFINGDAYFKALEAEIDALCRSKAKGRYLYLSAWWLGLARLPATTLVQPFGEQGTALLAPIAKNLVEPTQIGVEAHALELPSGTLLARKLEDLLKSGADVRILGWVSPFAARYAIPQLAGIRVVNVQTLLSIAEMRSRFGEFADKVMVNLVAHPMGASHCKLVVVGDQKSTRAFTGGIDPVMSRRAANWHDLAVRVTGPGAIAIYRFFQQLWAENLKLPPEGFVIDKAPIMSCLKTAGPIPDPPDLKGGDGTGACVQVLRTVPQMQFSTTGPAWLNQNAAVRTLITAGVGFRKAPIGFAPKGRFEFKVALQKAISRAEKFIFMADQGFSSQEIMSWINARLLEKPDLKVILLHGSDPADPPSGDLAEAVNSHLIPHLPIHLLHTSHVEGVEFHGWPGTAVHCKVTIIDDVFCIVGSANAMRRSLYTDIELSVAILDTTNTGIVRSLRRDLWAKYCGMHLPAEHLLVGVKDVGYDELLDIDNALSLWSPAWGGALPAGVRLLPAIRGFQLPMPATTAYSSDKHDLQDPDSRKVL
jgi:phosphatidylserine/phosphatidylglycerophosphate/cardiolipin synthase-like enzyme